MRKLLAVTACSLLVQTAWAQTAPVEISVEGTALGAPLRRIWAYYGFDEVNYTTTPEGRDLLQALVRAHDEPVHIRSHFLLNTNAGALGLKWGSTNVYTQDAQGNAVYDWTVMDGIMDTVTGLGAYPLAEIAFMPQALSTRPNPYRNSSVTALDGGLFYPPNDYQKWGDLIRAWASHTKERYPDAESTWLWELWNEPDIAYWKGTPAEFARLYDFTEAALHEVFPTAPLGGPETASAGAFLTQFLRHCAEEVNAVSGNVGTRLDLVTFHAKGGVALVNGNVRMNLGNQLRLHRDGFGIVAGFPQYRSTPIIVGEADPDGCAACSTADVPADAYRNSTAYGAYEVAMMKRSLELETRAGVNLRALLTWAFTFVPEPFFSGFRELSNNGIHKPVLNAFKLLGSLEGARLPVTSSGARSLDDILVNSVRAQPDVDALATRTTDGRVQVLVWNYHDDLVQVPAAPVHLGVALPATFGSRAHVRHLRADEAHGDAFTIWLRQGSPAAPSAAQIAEMQQGMEPAPLGPDTTLDVVDGALTLDFELPRFGISLITLAPVVAPVPDGRGTPPTGPTVEIPLSNPGNDDLGGSGPPQPGAGAPIGTAAPPADGTALLPENAPGSAAASPPSRAAERGCALGAPRHPGETPGSAPVLLALLGAALLRRRRR